MIAMISRVYVGNEGAPREYRIPLLQRSGKAALRQGDMELVGLGAAEIAGDIEQDRPAFPAEPEGIGRGCRSGRSAVTTCGGDAMGRHLSAVERASTRVWPTQFPQAAIQVSGLQRKGIPLPP
jgi:hypothetical protein